MSFVPYLGSMGILLATLTLPACSEPQRERPPSILLVTLDTVRADHLSCYGYTKETSPRLDALARSADRYTNAWATAPWTLPTHASLFTGRYTFQHRADASEEAPESATQNAAPLGQEAITLTELLKEQGYATAAFSANAAFLNAKFGLDQGFDVYRAERERAGEVVDAARTWLDEQADRDPGQPYFLFVNLMDAHRPYNVEPLSDGEVRGLRPSQESPGELLDQLIDQVMNGREPFPASLRDKVVVQYDNGIAHDDLALGSLLEHLEDAGQLDELLVIVTSDHGEYFGEHQLVEHNKDVYREALHVPLVVKRPRQREGRVIDEPVSLVHVPAWIGRELPPGPAARFRTQFVYDERDAFRIAEIHLSRPHELKAPWGARFQRTRQAYQIDQWKLILSSDGQNELYDLTRDPGEAHNLIDERRELAAKLEQRLVEFISTSQSLTPGAPPPLDPQLLDELWRLGYTEGKRE